MLMTPGSRADTHPAQSGRDPTSVRCNRASLAVASQHGVFARNLLEVTAGKPANRRAGNFRPRKNEMSLKRVDLVLSAEEVAAADKARKTTSRSEWIGALIRRACGLKCGPHMRGRPKEGSENVGTKTKTG